MLKYFISPSHKQLIIILLLLTLSGLNQAQDLQWYDIEVVAFAHANSKHLNTETWPENWSSPNTKTAINFDTINHNLFTEQVTQGTLSEVAKQIKQSSHYKLLNYKIWRQAGLSESKTKAVRIQSKNNIKNTNNKFIDELIQVPQLDGSISISLGRFLHIHTDLLYTATLEDVKILPKSSSSLKEITQTAIKTDHPLIPIVSKSSRLQGFILKNERKTRSKVMQFIDHPMFGLIVHITPIKAS